MILTSTVRLRPDAGATNVDDLPTEEISATADDYDTAYAELARQVPDGWQMLGIRSSQR